MQAVILAAGQSSRFYPFSNFPHKALVKIMGKTLLEHTLLSIKKAGITEVIIVVGKENLIEKSIGNGKQVGVHITYVIQPEPLGMGEALLRAQSHITDEFFLMNAYHMEFHEFSESMIKKEHKKDEIVLLGKEHEGVDRYGYMEVNEKKVVGIIEKPSEVQTSSLRIIGVYLLNKSFLDTLKLTPLDHYHFEDALHTYAAAGKATYVITERETLTLKYAWDLLEIKNYLLKDLPSYISPDAAVSKHTIMEGNVYIEEGAKVFESACLKGPCYIGKNAIVGNNALLRGGTCIEEKAVAGSYMEMTNTLIMAESTSHSGFIGDSIIGNKCKIGGMFCSANVRLDRKQVATEVKTKKVESFRKHLGTIIGDNVILGARVTTMPGVIIGNDSLIGPSTTVMENVGDNTKYYTKFEQVVKRQSKPTE